MTSVLGASMPTLDEIAATFLSLRWHHAAGVAAWEQCAGAADFLADCLAWRGDIPVSMLDLCSTIFNELIENAYLHGGEGEVDVCVGRLDRDVVCVVTNAVAADVDGLWTRLEQAIEVPTGDSLVSRVMRNRMADMDQAGLGFLTLRIDHGVRLGFRITNDGPRERHVLSTIARVETRER